jgi:hypothetical protein
MVMHSDEYRSKFANKLIIHNELMDDFDDCPHTRVFYMAEIRTELPDGYMLMKYGETDDIHATLFELLNKYEEDVLFTNMYMCAKHDDFKFEKQLNADPFIMFHKYHGEINDIDSEEILSLSPDKYKVVKRAMKKKLMVFNETNHGRDNLKMLTECVKTWPDIISNLIDPVAKTIAEKALATTMFKISQM